MKYSRCPVTFVKSCSRAVIKTHDTEKIALPTLSRLIESPSTLSIALIKIWLEKNTVAFQITVIRIAFFVQRPWCTVVHVIKTHDTRKKMTKKKDK